LKTERVGFNLAFWKLFFVHTRLLKTILQSAGQPTLAFHFLVMMWNQVAETSYYSNNTICIFTKENISDKWIFKRAFDITVGGWRRCHIKPCKSTFMFPYPEHWDIDFADWIHKGCLSREMFDTWKKKLPDGNQEKIRMLHTFAEIFITKNSTQWCFFQAKMSLAIQDYSLLCCQNYGGKISCSVPIFHQKYLIGIRIISKSNQICRVSTISSTFFFLLH